jgi:hypothetical protein
MDGVFFFFDAWLAAEQILDYWSSFIWKRIVPTKGLIIPHHAKFDRSNYLKAYNMAAFTLFSDP